MSDARDALVQGLLQVDALDHHGTRITYYAGCRCRPCTDANTVYQRQYRLRQAKGKVQPLADVPSGRVADLTAILVRSLMGEGYTLDRLSVLIGVSRRALINHTTSRPVTYRTAARIRRFWSAQQAE